VYQNEANKCANDAMQTIRSVATKPDAELTRIDREWKPDGRAKRPKHGRDCDAQSSPRTSAAERTSVATAEHAASGVATEGIVAGGRAKA
jgi:hypothetical protein